MLETLRDKNDGKCSYDLGEGTGLETDGCWNRFACLNDTDFIECLKTHAHKLERERDELRHQFRLMLWPTSKQPEELMLIDRKILDQVETLLNELDPETWLGLPFIEGLVAELKGSLTKTNMITSKEAVIYEEALVEGDPLLVEMLTDEELQLRYMQQKEETDKWMRKGNDLLNELNPAKWWGKSIIEGLVTELKEALNKN